MIQFPIFRRIDVRGYELFHNEKSDGIVHKFDRGVYAIVGINGLGKTTLLAMLYRALLGPFDQSKSDAAGLLGSQHELSNWRNKDFFRDRVSDGAAEATIEVDVAFGEAVVTIRRRLSNLRIDYLALNGSELEATNEVYEESIANLCGTATFFDFFAILRYLVFYLEDRVELIWDRRSQFDMMRVLLFDAKGAKAASDAYDDAQAADSRFRNRRAIVGKDRERLAELEQTAGQTQASEYRVLQIAVSQAEERDLAQATEIEEISGKIDGGRLRREKALLDLQEARTAVEFEEQAHYKHLFPSMGETAQHVFLNLLGGGGCLVCGSTTSAAADYLRAKLEEHRCPICDSIEEQQEKVVAPADFSRERLRRLKSKVSKLREAVAFVTVEIEHFEKEYEQLVDRRDDDRKELSRLRAELSQLGPIEVPDEDTIERLRSSVSEGEKAMDLLLAERTAAEGRYGRIIKKQGSAIDETAGAIRRRFRAYASMVLAERCELNITHEERSIGQEGRKFQFPYFEVMMTSGVFDQSLSVRSNPEAVSESQREFLDIAFRLSLIDAVTSDKADSMLVLETPESSLDSLFVAKAGEAFRHYAENSKRRNVLIASTNLNNEEMLSALLGVKPAPKTELTAASQVRLGRQKVPQSLPAPAVPKSQRLQRIINLLDLAAPNAALRQHRKYYTRLLKNALGR